MRNAMCGVWGCELEKHVSHVQCVRLKSPASNRFVSQRARFPKVDIKCPCFFTVNHFIFFLTNYPLSNLKHAVNDLSVVHAHQVLGELSTDYNNGVTFSLHQQGAVFTMQGYMYVCRKDYQLTCVVIFV